MDSLWALITILRRLFLLFFKKKVGFAYFKLEKQILISIAKDHEKVIAKMLSEMGGGRDNRLEVEMEINLTKY